MFELEIIDLPRLTPRSNFGESRIRLENLQGIDAIAGPVQIGAQPALMAILIGGQLQNFSAAVNAHAKANEHLAQIQQAVDREFDDSPAYHAREAAAEALDKLRVEQDAAKDAVRDAVNAREAALAADRDPRPFGAAVRDAESALADLTAWLERRAAAFNLAYAKATTAKEELWQRAAATVLSEMAARRSALKARVEVVAGEIAAELLLLDSTTKAFTANEARKP